MKKKFINMIVLFLLLSGVSLGLYKLNNKIDLGKSNVNDSSVEVSKKKNNSKSNENTNSIDNENNSNIPKITIDNEYSIEQDNNSKENNITSNKTNKNLYSDDYSVVVSSNTYNALVILDKDNKEINIKLIDESKANNTSTDRYINFTDEEIKYLVSNADELLKQFKGSNLLEKYSFVSKMLSKFDTNIKESDLITLAISYLK